MKDKIQQLHTEFTKLKEKILAKINQQGEAITQKDQALIESSKRIELQAKDNSENERVLEQLLTEFRELAEVLGE